MDYNCERCDKELKDGLFVADFLSGIVNEDKGHSIDLCEKCMNEISSLIKIWWKNDLDSRATLKTHEMVHLLKVIEIALTKYYLADIDDRITFLEIDLPLNTAKSISKLMCDLC